MEEWGASIQYNINGLSGNSVRIFIDGIPIRNYGASFSLSSIPPALIERIEVYKGVIRTHLSEDALGGAINVILKKTEQGDKSLSASYSLGSFNTHQANLSGSYRDKKSGFTAIRSAFYNYTDNDYKVWGDQVYVTEPSLWQLEYVKAKRFHDSFKSAGVTIDAGFTDVKWADKFLIGGLYSDMDKDVQHGGTMEVVYGNRQTRQTTKMVNVRYDKKRLIKNLDVTNNISAQFSEIKQAFEPTERNRTEKIELQQVQDNIVAKKKQEQIVERNRDQDTDNSLNSNFCQWEKVITEIKKLDSQYRTIILRENTATVSTDAIFGNKRALDHYVFNPETGKILSSSLYTNQEISGKMRGWIYSVHVGSWGGLLTQCITFFASIFGASLPITGYYIWIRKGINKKKYRNMRSKITVN